MGDPVRRDLPIALAVRVGLLAFVGGLALVGLRLAVVQPPTGDAPPCDRAYVRSYDQPRTKVETVMAATDAQAWAALGTDPTFSDAGNFCDGTVELVYRASRPLFVWLIWAGSFGQPGATPYSLMVWSAIGVGVFAFACVLAASESGRRPIQGALALALPGAAAGVLLLGPEPFAVGLGLLGLICWKRGGELRLPAVALFTLAILMRELLVVVPMVLVLQGLVVERQRLRRLLVLAVPVGIYVGWIAWVFARYRMLPNTNGPNRWEGTSAPFVGLTQAMQANPETVMALVVMVVVLALAVWRDRRSELTWGALVLAVVSTVMGRGVWQLEPFRVFLPLYTFALLAALPPLATRVRAVRRPDADVDAAST